MMADMKRDAEEATTVTFDKDLKAKKSSASGEEGTDLEQMYADRSVVGRQSAMGKTAAQIEREDAAMMEGKKLDIDTEGGQAQGKRRKEKKQSPTSNNSSPNNDTQGSGWDRLKAIVTEDTVYEVESMEKNKKGKLVAKKRTHWDRKFKLDAILAQKSAEAVHVDRRYYVHAQWLKLKDELQLAVYFVIGLSEAKMQADLNFGTVPYAIPMIASKLFKTVAESAAVEDA